MGFVEAASLSYKLPDGRELFADVSFKVRPGQHAAIVGANGSGKTTLLRILAGDLTASDGAVRIDGHALFMRQFIGSVRDTSTVADLLAGLAPEPVRKARVRLRQAEEAVRLPHGRTADIAYADALAAWGDAGGYDYEVLWDICTSRAFGESFEDVRDRPVRTLSGGEQKKLALEALVRSDADILLLDEPDNFLDIDGKRWLEGTLNDTDKTVLYVSHDRELLARTSHRVVTIEATGAWTHEASFATYHEARLDRLDRLDEQHRRWREEHKRLVEMMKEFKRRAAISDVFASRAKAAETRVKRYEDTVPEPKRPKDQAIDMRLQGGRTGKRVLVCEGLSIAGIVDPFDAEIWFGERVAVVGPNGTGKSHFLRLLAGEPIKTRGQFRLGARVTPGYFSQTHDAAEMVDGTRLRELLASQGLDRGGSMRLLRRYELQDAYDQHLDTLSGGQQARVQILRLELGGATLLLLDEPTDNLDIASAEALEDAIAAFEGTVIAVTHDRWFMRSFDRFLHFADGGSVTELAAAPAG